MLLTNALALGIWIIMSTAEAVHMPERQWIATWMYVAGAVFLFMIDRIIEWKMRLHIAPVQGAIQQLIHDHFP